MEGLLWNMLRLLLGAIQEAVPRGIYSDREVFEISLWAVLHDRPVCWACDAANWPAELRPRRLPHASTVSRRLRGASMQHFTQQAHQTLVARFQVEKVALLDGKPLLVSDVSKDWDATNGRGTRGMSRGYKLHCVMSLRGVVEAFEVQPLNVNERVPARRLCQQLPPQVRRILADGGYDSGPLHESLRTKRIKLYTPVLNHYAGPRSHPRRRILVRLFNTPLGPRIKALRDHVERRLAWMGNLGFGLKGLPNWVRRLRRVERWISSKILFYNTYQLIKLSAS